MGATFSAARSGRVSSQQYLVADSSNKGLVSVTLGRAGVSLSVRADSFNPVINGSCLRRIIKQSHDCSRLRRLFDSLRRLRLKRNEHDRPFHQRSARQDPTREQTAGTSVFLTQWRHGCGRNRSGHQQTKTRRLGAILVVHHFVSETGQSFRPDVLSIHTSFFANGERYGVLPTNIKTFMEISSVLRVGVLS